MTRQDVKHWLARHWWNIAVVILIPLTVMAFRRWDADNVKRDEWEAFKFGLRVQYVTDSLHHAQDDQRTAYLICRQDFSRRECLRPDR